MAVSCYPDMLGDILLSEYSSGNFNGLEEE